MPQSATVRRRALLLCVALLASCGDDGGPASPVTTATSAPATTSTTAPSVVPPPAPVDPLGGYVAPAIEWSPCGSGSECGSLAVPLDWDLPSGPTIGVFVVRTPAADADRRIGALVVNPGGPGASGVDFAWGGGPYAGTALGERYDVVSWDPRGVGGSAPLECGGRAVERFLRLDSDPDDAAEQAALDSGAEAIALDCAARDGDVLPHVGTDDVARDLEALRRTLGVPVAYHGFSYGTLIGLRHAALFPGALARMVLDAVVDPTASLADLLRSQATATEATLAGLLGDRLADWDELARRVETAPVPADDGRSLGPADVSTAGFRAGYAEQYGEVLRDGLADALDGDGTLLLGLADDYRAFGSFTAYQAVSCVDSAHPIGPAAWAAFAAEVEALAPRLGPGVANEMLPCAYWPVAPSPVTGPVRAEGSGPILVVGTTGDPITPLAQAQRVAAMLADGHLLVHEGGGHGAYGSNRCVDEAVERYLVDGVVPDAGTRC